MWKDFFYYSKSERRAVYVLLVMIAVLVVAVFFVSGQQESSQQIVSDSLECESLIPGVEKKHGKPLKGVKESVVALFPFEPNLVDSMDLVRLGLPAYVVRNVIKYRQKGGRFSTPEAFSRIYGLSEEKFAELKPYIYILKDFVRKPVGTVKERIAKNKVKEDTLIRVFKYPEGTWVDVNLADTSELKKIPGIGSGIANRIVSYRTRLGGFYSLEQLREVKFVTPEMLEWFKIGHDSVRKLEINKAGLDKLRAHPYLNFYQAKAILEHRRTRGKITSLSQLSLYEEFTEKDLQRLSAYLSFD